MPAALLVKGHTLLDEGRVIQYQRLLNGVGQGRCSCGQRSTELPSTSARKQWHRDHKVEVRAAADQAGVERALAQMMRPAR